VENTRNTPSNRATSPYLRKPIRSLDQVRHEEHAYAGDAGPQEQADQRLDNHAFRMSARG
jgi:hypothetical protein